MPIIEQRAGSGGRDNKGAITLARKFVVDTLEEVFNVAPERALFGLPEDTRNYTQQSEGAGRYEVNITYKGISPSGPSPQSPDADSAQWSGKVVIREEPLESCPELQQLLTEYEGTIKKENGKVVLDWPEFLTSGGGGSGLGSGGNGKVRNPMFGAKTYPVISGEVQVEYVWANSKLPNDLYNRVGRALPALPGGRVPTPDGYVWIVMCPEFVQHGERAWKIRQSYRLAKKDSYIAIIHKVIGR
jgi:hypothetical protein